MRQRVRELFPGFQVHLNISYKSGCNALDKNSVKHTSSKISSSMNVMLQHYGKFLNNAFKIYCLLDNCESIIFHRRDQLGH
jgi:hypothetical protein